MGLMDARRLSSICLVWLSVLAGWMVLSASASALNVHTFSFSFGGEGSEEGKFNAPEGVAVNDTTHDVYVTDSGNGRVEEFTSEGVFIRQFAPPAGFGIEPFVVSPAAIAVDNSGDPSTDPSAGDVYVVDPVDKVVDKFNGAGVYEGQLTAGENDVPVGVAVDPTGVVWVNLENNTAQKKELDSFSDAQVNVFLAQHAPPGCNAGSGL